MVTHSFLRTPAEKLKPILAELRWHEISAQMDEGFHMVSLLRGDLDLFKYRITKAGGYSMYTMWPPVHAGVFGGLRDRVETEVIDKYTFRDPRLPVVSDQDGAVIDSAEGVRGLILGGVVRPIRWPAVLETLGRQGVDTVYLPGPENLFARLRGMARAFTTVAVTPKSALRVAK